MDRETATMPVPYAPGHRLVLTLAVLAAVVSSPLLPPQHVHRAGIEGRTEPLVHAHLTESAPLPAPSGAAALSIPHGDHRLAVVLDVVYTAAGAAGSHGSLASVDVITCPPRGTPRVVPRRQTDRIHGPPRLVPVTRGPPILS
jgi:hypothetical protein